MDCFVWYSRDARDAGGRVVGRKHDCVRRRITVQRPTTGLRLVDAVTGDRSTDSHLDTGSDVRVASQPCFPGWCYACKPSTGNAARASQAKRERRRSHCSTAVSCARLELQGELHVDLRDQFRCVRRLCHQPGLFPEQESGAVALASRAQVTSRELILLPTWVELTSD